ncbi:SDR family NAD(P)-dependent oxidoreductase [Acidisoma cladoniae]|uniref:SDR family NAD(P)-dependent oxidoreductase n=1 Tax=Acidisoma cladoniae TaxID=3040935 RepID=UPI00254C8193|nr:SDR family NAD(P)-dependent oxidoreductase [Acidisoma sp. PAMC 29798]
MHSFPADSSAIVIGASGGIGSALVTALLDQPVFGKVIALARSFGDDLDVAPGLRRGVIDISDEDSIRAAADRLADDVRLVIVATGALQGGGIPSPEKTYRAIDAAGMLESYRINAIGPALVAKHMLPKLSSQGRSVFAVLSARVGSIGDNRSGGWHSYRASKAALNMIVRNLAIETARRHPQRICVGLHPGTVDTELSRPFQRGVAEGRLFTAVRAASCLLTVIDGLTPSDSGRVLAWDGSTIAP